MVVSWTPLFVLFDFGPAAGLHKTLSENSNDAIRAGAKQEKSLSKAPSEPDSISAIHGVVIDRDRENNMQVTMKDRVAVVTGGSKGIGLAVARRFAASGAKVAILARGAQDLKAAREQLGKEGLDVSDYLCDVSKASDIASAHEKIVSDLGPVDILVNNAGTARTMAFENISDEAWQEDLDLKLFAAIRFSRLVWPGMKARKWGRIINVLNTYAKAPAASSAPTSVSRAAGMALTKLMASEGGEHNILVNAMLVGLIMSDQWVKRHAAQAPDMDFEVFANNLAKGTPLGRIGTAAEFANLACFLASEQGSFITGTAINVDGGRSPVV
jgi:3-oxoacyl-[acyl-carrier protein] reductase